MKFTLAAIVIVALVACSTALPAKKRMAYYQQPAQFYQTPQRMMYVQYVQPAQTHARSTQGAEALVAGDSVAAGTYLKDCDNVEADVAALSSNGEDVLAEAGAQGAQSVAEAYPAEAKPQSDDEAKVPRDYNFDAAAAGAEEQAVEVELDAAVAPAVVADLPAAQPAKPVVPAKRYLPAKKKVFVELEQPAVEDEEADEEVANSAGVAADEAAAAAAAVDDEEDDDVQAVPVAPKKQNARRPAVRKPVESGKPAAKPSKPGKPLPAGTFFPIDFGGTNGGAIAIANSFSTGDGGSATSHAIAYGSPDAVRARVRPNKYH